MIDLIRNMFEGALKTNDSLYMAVLTGCLRVRMDAPSSLGSKTPRQVNEVGVRAKLENTSPSTQSQSVFTGLNNLRVLSITSFSCADSFGFTDEEVKTMLKYYDLEDKYEVVKEWYDGYCFGDKNVYCPWDVINYINDLLDRRTLPPQNYWINTSSNEAVRTLLEKASSDTRGEIERLIAGESISKVINEELTYKELYDNVENVWSVLFITGYLTQRGEPDGKMRKLAIPNREIQDIFLTQIQKDAGCEEAMRQIEQERYVEQPRLDGMSRVVKCGIACHVKECRVVFST